jgi:hypothetical protein
VAALLLKSGVSDQSEDHDAYADPDMQLDKQGEVPNERIWPATISRKARNCNTMDSSNEGTGIVEPTVGSRTKGMQQTGLMSEESVCPLPITRTASLNMTCKSLPVSAECPLPLAHDFSGG